jgi:hypothetical protein
VLIEKTDAWHNGMSPPSHQQRLESLTTALWSLANARLGVASVIANLHHRRIELRIFERSDVANPSSLARSRCDRTTQNNSVLSPKPVHMAIKQ